MTVAQIKKQKKTQYTNKQDPFKPHRWYISLKQEEPQPKKVVKHWMYRSVTEGRSHKMTMVWGLGDPVSDWSTYWCDFTTGHSSHVH